MSHQYSNLINHLSDITENEIEIVTEGAVTPLVKIHVGKLKSKVSVLTHNLVIEKNNSEVNEKIKLEQWIQQFRVSKGQPFTHTSLKGGIYNIPIISLKSLHKLIKDSENPQHLSEKHPERASSICIDFDFRQSVESTTRIFDLDYLTKIVELYNHHLQKMGISDQMTLMVVVLYRDSGYIDTKSNLFKDGFHVQYPNLVIDYDSQYELRLRVIEDLKKCNWMPKTTNTLEDIVDKAVISKNNWLLYGCSKPELSAYKVRHVFQPIDGHLTIIEPKYTQLKWTNLLSLQLMDSKQITLTYWIPTLAVIAPTIEIAKKHPKLRKTTVSKSELETIKALVSILSKERADSQKTWINVGLCLHNLCSSLLDSWIDFSRKSLKFEENECQKLWEKMTIKETGGLGLGSLYLWAKLDNPLEYQKINTYYIRSFILKSISQTTQDCAKVLYEMYKYEFKCASVKKNIWYQFSNHKWQQIESVVLRNRIGNELIREYLRVTAYYTNQAINSTDENEVDKFHQKQKNLTDVTYKLRDIQFKKKIIEECAGFFYERDFEEKFNLNPDLLCFDNGVYDLSSDTFRDGYPEDYITISVGYDYIKVDETDKNIICIYAFISSIFPDPEMRDYMLVLLASFLEGRNPHEKFYVFTGSGGNGKSKLVEFFEIVCGKYAQKIPSTVFTQKKASSNCASPELIVLVGARFASTEEPDEDGKFNTGSMKEYTGGSLISLRGLFKDQISFKPQFKLAFCCNTPPKMDHKDGGAKRRTRIIYFGSKFVDNPDPLNPNEYQIDPLLSEKFDQWKQAFMYILLEHYKTYKKSGLKEPKSVLLTTADYWAESNEIKSFVNEYLEKDEISGKDSNGKDIIIANSYVILDDIWNKFKKSDFYDNKLKLLKKTAFAVDLQKIIGKYSERPMFKGKQLGSKFAFIGWKLITQDGQTKPDEIPQYILKND